MTCLSSKDVFDAKNKTEYITSGIKHTKKQATAKQHVEIFLKFNLLLFLSLSLAIAGAFFLSLRFDLAMMNML
jgi:hypothetical protein